MIATYVRAGGTSIGSFGAPGIPVLHGFLRDICNREVGRQHLDSSPEQQLESFRDVATNHLGLNPVFHIDDLFSAVRGFVSSDEDKVFDHPLLTASEIGGSNHYSFSYDFLAPFLRALTVDAWLRKSGPKMGCLPRELVESLVAEADGKGEVLEQLIGFLSLSDLDRVIDAAKLAASTRGYGYLGSFFFHVAQCVVNAQAGTTMTVRTDRLLRSIAAGGTAKGAATNVVGWWFRGMMGELDFRDVTFERCRFADIRFRRCLVDHSTRFVGCTFEGAQVVEGGANDWHQVLFQQCRFVPPAGMYWTSLVSRALGDKEENARYLVKAGVEKFWRGGVLVEFLSEAGWSTGQLSGAGRGATVLLETMLSKGLLVRVNIDGGRGLAVDRSSRGDVMNYMDNNLLSGKVQEVYLRLLAGI